MVESYFGHGKNIISYGARIVLKPNITLLKNEHQFHVIVIEILIYACEYVNSKCTQNLLYG